MTDQDAQTNEHIDKLVAAAPLPTDEQARHLWLLLHPPAQPAEPDQPATT